MATTAKTEIDTNRVLLLGFSSECNNNFKTPNHSFKDGKYYRDEKYFGDVIYCDETTIQVECNNGNKYMQGQIITMQLVSS